MQSKCRPSLVRNCAGEIVDGTAGCAEEKHLCAGFELIQESARLAQTNRC
jgi:hypothetical protein